ncbi:MAG: hypothetical protein RID07_04150 [Lacipirellulaceae bacterium]|uniref:hypothetical protein n=1 Tax=Erythrobacter sp. TaxID=1042 RepID=UPI0032F009DD
MATESERSDAIGGWLSDDDRAEFREYACKIGISGAALATVIWTRELYQRRLGDLKVRFETTTGGKGGRITARPSRAGFREDFAAHAESFGLSPDAAASLVLRDELETRWLGTQLGLYGEST